MTPYGNRDLWSVIFKQILVIDGWGISFEIALIWMSLDFTDDQSTLVQVMAWCRQATSHYLSQSWPRSLLPYGVTRPQWVNSLYNIAFIYVVLPAISYVIYFPMAFRVASIVSVQSHDCPMKQQRLGSNLQLTSHSKTYAAVDSWNVRKWPILLFNFLHHLT